MWLRAAPRARTCFRMRGDVYMCSADTSGSARRAGRAGARHVHSYWVLTLCTPERRAALRIQVSGRSLSSCPRCPVHTIEERGRSKARLGLAPALVDAMLDLRSRQCLSRVVRPVALAFVLGNFAEVLPSAPICVDPRCWDNKVVYQVLTVRDEHRLHRALCGSQQLLRRHVAWHLREAGLHQRARR